MPSLEFISGEVRTGLEIQHLLVATIPPSQASKLVKELAQASPLPGLQHLKRIQRLSTGNNSVKALEIILHALSEKPSADRKGQAWVQHELTAIGVPPAVTDFIAGHSLEPRFAQGAKYAPRTREQLTEWSKLWPISWRQPETVSAAPEDSLTPEEALEVQRNVLRMLHMAECSCQGASDFHSAFYNASPEGQTADSGIDQRIPSAKEPSSLCNIAVIVDTEGAEVIALAQDGTSSPNRHPLQHAVMSAINIAAQRDLRLWPPGGRVSSQRLDAADQSCQGCPDHSSVAGLRSAEDARQSSADSQPALSSVAGGLRQPQFVAEQACSAKHAGSKASSQPHSSAPATKYGNAPCAPQDSHAKEHDAKRRCLEGTGAVSQANVSLQQDTCSTVRLPIMQDPSASGTAFSTSSANADERTCVVEVAGRAEEGSAPSSSKPYLCTGWDCYTVHEPCAMCAMALVHSRVRRVIFCEPDLRHGALGGSFRLHGQKSLNHHYQVYRFLAA